MKKFFVFLLLSFILFSFPVFAGKLYQYGVKAEIHNNTVYYELNLIFVNHPTQEFSISLGSPKDVKIDTTANCEIQENVLGTEVKCSMEISERTVITINYNSDETLIKKGNYYLFSDSFKMFYDTEIVSVIVKLPEGTGLREPIENSYIPQDGLIGGDGRRTILSWQKNDLESEERFDVSIAFEGFGGLIIPSSFTPEVFVAIIFVIIVGFIFIYKVFLSKRFVKLILPILKKDEKIIFDTLMKHGSGVNQKVIVRESGYSKAKVSKVLNSLKERGIVRLERIGRSNKIYIEKDFPKKK